MSPRQACRQPSASTCRWLLLGLLHGLLRGAAASQATSFLLISAPRNNKVSWVALPEDGNYEGLSPKTLIDSVLQHPQGLAVDQKSKRLYVTDPDVKKIFSYQLDIQGGELRVVGEPKAIVVGSESRWVAVDGMGNIFFSDEPQNLILKVSADRALRGESSGQILYTGHSMKEVNEPGGVAVDNLHLYWTNKHFGTEVGTVVRGSEFPAGNSSSAVNVLARNAVKSYGICLALDNVYFTDSDRYLYGVKKSGGQVAQVSADLKSPRGCAWDGDGTVYVADRDANAVYAFAGNMHTLGGTELKQAIEYEDAFGLAVLTSSARRFCRSWLLSVMLAAFATGLAA